MEDKPERLDDMPESPNERIVSVGDMIRMCQEAASKMSFENPNKLLMINCSYTMRQLVKRISKLEEQLQKATVHKVN